MPTKTKKDRSTYLINSIQTQNDTELNWNHVLQSPAVYFLTEVVNLNKSLRYCMEQFPSRDRAVPRAGYKTTEKLTVEGQKVMKRLSASVFVAMMGHFEIFQRSFVSGLFEATRFMRNINIDAVVKRILGDSRDTGIRIIDIAAYRGQPTNIGDLLTDNILGWHNPHRVNEIINAMLEKVNFYSASDIDYLNCLWQIRHSIAHRGGWLTLPDAQKVPQLKSISDKLVSFDHNFIRQVHVEFHGIIKSSVKRASESFNNRIEIDYRGSENEINRILQNKELIDLFKVTSPRESQLRR
jgi:hypothetical protein